MRPHRSIPCVWIAALAVISWIGPQVARGGSTMGFRLSNQGSQSVGRIDLSVVPPGAVVPPVVGTDPTTGDALTGSPLTMLTTSAGFDQSLFSVALGSRPDAEILRLLFGQTQTVHSDGSVTFDAQVDASGNPIGLFGPGATLDFSLSVDTNLMSSMRLELPEAAGGIVLQSWPTTDASGGDSQATDGGSNNTGGTPSTATQVPEPGVCVVWGLMLIVVAGTRRMRWKPPQVGHDSNAPFEPN